MKNIGFPWRKHLAAYGLGAMLALGFAAASFGQAAPVVGATVALPAVTLIDGRKLPAGYFQGKPVIIEYWASWCPFCGRQNPNLQTLMLEAQKKGLEILTVSVDRDESAAKAYMKEHRYTFPVAMETPELLKALGRREMIPEIFVIGPDGKVAQILSGEKPRQDVLDLIKYAPADR